MKHYGAATSAAIRIINHKAESAYGLWCFDWCPPFSGYHLYYRSRRQHTPAS